MAFSSSSLDPILSSGINILYFNLSIVKCSCSKLPINFRMGCLENVEFGLFLDSKPCQLGILNKPLRELVFSVPFQKIEEIVDLVISRFCLFNNERAFLGFSFNTNPPFSQLIIKFYFTKEYSKSISLKIQYL